MDLKKVPSDEQVIAQGYDEFRHTWWHDPSGRSAPLPDYLNDMNAMHEAEKSLKGKAHSSATTDEEIEYCRHLSEIIGVEWFRVPRMVMATAAQKAEAFLRTIGRWEDEV